MALRTPKPCSGVQLLLVSPVSATPACPVCWSLRCQGDCGAEPAWAAQWDPHWHRAGGPPNEGRFPCFPCPVLPLLATSLSPGCSVQVGGPGKGPSTPAVPCTPPLHPAVPPAVTPVPPPTCTSSSRPLPHPTGSIPRLHSSSWSFSCSPCPQSPHPLPIDCISSQAFPAARGRRRQVRGTRDSGDGPGSQTITDPLAPLLLCSHRVHAHPHPTETAGHAEETQ